MGRAKSSVLSLFIVALMAVCVAFESSQARAEDVVSPKASRALEFPRDTMALMSVCYSGDGMYVTAGGAKGPVCSWDAATGKGVSQIFHGPPAEPVVVWAVACFPDVPIAVHVSEVGIRFHIIAGHHDKIDLDVPHKATVQAVDFSRDGQHMATGDRRGQTMVSNLWSGTTERTFPGSSDVLMVRYHPDGNRLAVAHKDGRVKIWDVRENTLQLEVIAHPKSGAFSCDFSADGTWLATSGVDDPDVKIWHAADGKPAGTLSGHRAMVNVVRFSPTSGSSLLASGSDDKTMKFWDVSRRVLVQSVSLEHPVQSLAWRPDAKAIVAGAGATLEIFDAKAP